MMMVFGSDYGQVHPVIPKGSRQDIVSTSLKEPYLWDHCNVLKLTANMRTSKGATPSEEIAGVLVMLLDVINGACYLQNTDLACCVAVYTGNETKLGMSRDVAEPKLTTMDAMIDKLIGAIFIFQIVVVIVLGIAGIIWKDTKCPLRVISYLLEPELIFIFSLCSIDVELLNAINTGSLDATSFLTVMAICNTVIPIKSYKWNIIIHQIHFTQTPPRSPGLDLSEDENTAEVVFAAKLDQLKIADG
ncbi:phospholipid-transporting ATPase 2 isoform X1 [Tanacetum coccineum]